MRQSTAIVLDLVIFVAFVIMTSVGLYSVCEWDSAKNEFKDKRCSFTVICVAVLAACVATLLLELMVAWSGGGRGQRALN